jgi:hypothetical protein
MVTTQETDGTRPGVGAALIAFAVFALIVAGAVLVARRQGEPTKNRWSAARVEESANGEQVEMVTVMRRAEHRSEASSFRSAEMVTIAGRGSLDLTGARMAGDSGRLEVLVIGGRAQVRVPPEWAVVIEDSLAVGAVDNRARRAEADPARKLILEAVVLGGRLEVTH